MSVTSNGELAKLEAVYRPLADSVRRLIDATIRTQVDAATLTAAKEKIDCATEQLSAALMPGSFGVHQTGDGQAMAWGNVAILPTHRASPFRLKACLSTRGRASMTAWGDETKIGANR